MRPSKLKTAVARPDNAQSRNSIGGMPGYKKQQNTGSELRQTHQAEI